LHKFVGGGEEKLPFANSSFDAVCRNVCFRGRDLKRRKLPRRSSPISPNLKGFEIYPDEYTFITNEMELT